MATVTKTSAATISRLLNSADILKSSAGAGRVSTVTTEGFEVKNIDGEIVVRYVSSSSMKSDKSYEAFETRKLIAYTDILVVLSANGYALTFREGRGWIVTKAVA